MSQLAQGAEPPMFLQRPSSARSQDVTHVLARTFRELFTRDSIGQDTVQYLNQSRGSDNTYHEKYVEALQKVQAQREQRLAEVAMLERHIMQAQARAMSADERQLNRAASASSRFPDLGLPPVRSHFRSCIDTDLLRRHNLITPEDFATEEPPQVPPPRPPVSAGSSLRQSVCSQRSAPTVPTYARETVTSTKRKTSGGTPDDEVRMAGGAESPRDSLHSSISNLSCDSDCLDQLLPPACQSGGLHQVSAAWEDQINPEEREVSRVALANLQSKVNYLKNPRHVVPSEGGTMLTKPKKKVPKEIGIKLKTNKVGSKEQTTVFVPSPPVICFTEYNVGHVFEMTLELKNVTGAMRPVRVVPPGTGYFSVGLGQFPGDQGLVAPGMSCHYTVRFSPDSLTDYDDYLTVQTQSSRPLIIPLQGRRTPPVISLPENINIGQCLIGGRKVARLAVVNEGGPGRFCMMKRKSWPASNFKLTVSSGSVELPPFEIRPAVFELGSNSQTMIEVHFMPTSKETYTENLTMVCDNCHVKHFTITGEGQHAGVELISMEGGLATAVPGELCDVTAQNLIRFDPLNPYTYYQRALTVKNQANVEVPFSWVVVKPILEPPDPEKVDSSSRVAGPLKRVQDVESAFSVEPQIGTLPPSGVAEFMVTFAPPTVAEYHSVLHLILRDIPQPITQERPASTTSERVAQLVLPPGGSVIQDLTAMECEVKATCEPFSVMLMPYAIHIPGQVLIESSIKRQFRMVNTSVSSVLFQWEKVHCPNYIMEVEPPIGELGPQEELELELTVSGSKPGKLTHTLQCQVQHLEDPLILTVQAEIKGPEVVMENPNLDLGLVRLGETAQQIISVRNMCQVAAQWRIQELRSSEGDVDLDKEEEEFVFSPQEGELRPLEAVDVKVAFRPRTTKSLRTVFELHVKDGKKSALAVQAEVQQPLACLLNCQLNMPDVFLNVETTHQVTLLNQTLLPTYFEWGEVHGDDRDRCSVRVEPRVGNLSPRQRATINVLFTAHEPGEMSRLLLPCTVAGMDKPLYLSLSCNVLGLSVSYRTSSDTGESSGLPEDLLLDLGQSDLSEDPPRCLLYITNNSAITAPFHLSVQNFHAKPPTPPGGRPCVQAPNKSQHRALLGRTPNLADPRSKTESKAQVELSRTMLRAGKGAAFLVQPATGVLQPFGEQVIEVIGFSDIWGEYTDILHCRVEMLPVVKIPIRMTSSGCPLRFQMVAAKPNQKPILRFGTHVSGVEPVVRQMRINNPSPCDIRVDWSVFCDDVTSRQVVDLVTTFGKAFPLLDADGQEIVPPREGPKSPAMWRQPTDHISNSTETSPTVSREVTRDDTDQVGESRQPSAGVRSERPKVISLTLREHHGALVSQPYQILPPQQVIPAKGNSCMSVSFTPRTEGDGSSTDQPGDTDCPGYALGYMSLDHGVAEVKGQVSRREGYEVAPLRLDMTAHVEPALLTIECTEEDGMVYRAAASDLLHNGQVAVEEFRVCSTRLSNHTETPLVFRLRSADPFKIVQLDPTTRRPVTRLLETENFTLHPQHNVMVQVGFRVSLELLEYLQVLKDGQSDGVTLETVGRENRLHFQQHLVVQFNNNTTQRVPLYGTLTIPALVLSKTTLDFGTCLVGQTRELQLELSNPTASLSAWTATIESKSETCAVQTFTVTPSSGSLEAFVTYVSESKVLLKVFFVAKHSENYEAVFVFRGMLGEEPSRLEVKGQGSYDGNYDAVVNV